MVLLHLPTLKWATHNMQYRLFRLKLPHKPCFIHCVRRSSQQSKLLNLYMLATFTVQLYVYVSNLCIAYILLSYSSIVPRCLLLPIHEEKQSLSFDAKLKTYPNNCRVIAILRYPIIIVVVCKTWSTCPQPLHVHQTLPGASLNITMIEFTLSLK